MKSPRLSTLLNLLDPLQSLERDDQKSNHALKKAAELAAASLNWTADNKQPKVLPLTAIWQGKFRSKSWKQNPFAANNRRKFEKTQAAPSQGVAAGSSSAAGGSSAAGELLMLVFS